MLVKWFYGGIRTLLFLWWTITVEPVLEGNLYRKTTLNSLNKQFIPTKCIHVFLCLKKDVISYSKNISDVKEGEAKKVQVTE